MAPRGSNAQHMFTVLCASLFTVDAERASFNRRITNPHPTMGAMPAPHFLQNVNACSILKAVHISQHVSRLSHLFPET